MIIDANRLEEIKVEGIRLYDPRERFYKIPHPHFAEFAISDYSHLIEWNPDVNGWHTYKTVQIRNHNRRKAPIIKCTLKRMIGEYYVEICAWENGKKRIIPYDLNEIVRMTFFPDASYIIYQGETIDHGKSKNPQKRRPERNVTNYYILYNWQGYLDYLKAKLCRNYVPQKHEFINRTEKTIDTNKYLDDGITAVNKIPGLSLDVINKRYSWMKSRSSDENYKKRKDKVRYRDTVRCAEWDTRLNFQKWTNDNYYFYPDTLELDKDIFGLCKTNEYAPWYCCYVPKYINQLFTISKNDHPEKEYLGYAIHKKIKKGKVIYTLQTRRYKRTDFFSPAKQFENYIGALNYGRKREADKIRSVVSWERERGYMPEKILDQMLYCATLIEAGKFDAFEPDEETIIKELKGKGTT